MSPTLMSPDEMALRVTSTSIFERSVRMIVNDRSRWSELVNHLQLNERIATEVGRRVESEVSRRVREEVNSRVEEEVRRQLPGIVIESLAGQRIQQEVNHLLQRIVSDPAHHVLVDQHRAEMVRRVNETIVDQTQRLNRYADTQAEAVRIKCETGLTELKDRLQQLDRVETGTVVNAIVDIACLATIGFLGVIYIANR